MFAKLGLIAAGMTVLGGVIVQGAALPVQIRDVATVTRETDVKPIKLAPYNPRKKKAALAATFSVASDAPAMNLETSETLYWFSDGYYASATLTAVDEKQKIVSIEAWEDLIESLECPSPSDITMTISDKKSIQEVQSDLAWVTEAKENKFILVTDEECGGDDGRQPYIIHDFKINEAAGKVTLKGEPVEWESLGVETSLRLATEPFGVFLDDADDELARRSSGFIDLAKDMSGFTLASHVQSGITLALTCAECKVTGGINWDLTFNKNPFSDDFGPQGQLSTANGFGGRFALGVKASGALLDGFDLANVELIAIPLTPISLGKIAKLTPQITVNAKASISAIQAEVEAKFGVGMSIPDGTTLRISGKSDPINPDFQMIGPELKGKVSVTALLTPVVTLDITAEVLSKGVTVGFGLEAPAFDAKLAVEANTEGVCGNPNAILGLSGSVGVGAVLNFFYGIGQPKDQPNKIELLRRRHELWGECLVLGEKPVEQPPVEQPPVEQPPVEQPPVEEPPVVTPPVVDPPVEQPPIETPPVEEPPVATPPVEEPPVVTSPVEEPPVVTPPVDETPVVTPPVEEPPVVTPPVEEPPVETPPVETPPVETLSVVTTPAETPVATPSGQIPSGLPVEETPTGPVVEAPVSETPVPGTPIFSTPVPESPATPTTEVDSPTPTVVVPETPGNSTQPGVPTPSGPSCPARRRRVRRDN